MTYVSDRAFRLTPGFRTVHRRAIVRGVVEAEIEASPLLASTAAAILADTYEEEQRQSVAEGLLRFGRWNPVVYSLLHSGTMAFYSDTIGRIHPSDPLSDGLMERLAPSTPGTVVAAQVRHRFGDQGALALAHDIIKNEASATESGQSELMEVVFDWDTEYPDQDFQVIGDRRRNEVTISRVAPASAPKESLTIRLGKEERQWLTTTGSDELTIPLDGKPIRIDPQGITKQKSRANDIWPRPFSLTTAAAIYTVNLRRAYAEAFAAAWLRQAHNSRHIGSISLATDRENQVSSTIGYAHQFGESITGTARSHRVGLSVRSALLNPNFAEVSDQRVTAESYLSWRWSTRDDDIFPRRGHAVRVNGGGGLSPGTDVRWWSLGSAASKLLSPHPHHAFAVRASVAMAQSDLEHRLLDLGGPSALRSLPTAMWLVNTRAVGMVEYRHAVFRDLSVPLLLAWGSEVQLTTGFECGAGRQENTPMEACGVTAGLAGVGDGLGGIEQLVGLTAGWPVWTHAIEADQSWVPEIYLRLWQEF